MTASYQTRLIIRDVTGKYTWDSAVLYGPKPSSLQSSKGEEGGGRREEGGGRRRWEEGGGDGRRERKRTRKRDNGVFYPSYYSK